MIDHLALAFDADRARAIRVTLMRIVVLIGVTVAAFVVRHWATWTLFGVMTFLQLPGVLVLSWVARRNAAARARLEAEPTRLVWLHTMPEPRTKLHRIELHERNGEQTVLFVLPEIAKRCAEATRELAHRPAISTSEEERKAEEPRQRLEGKLVRLGEAARSAKAPRLREQSASVEAFLASWKASGREHATTIEPKIDRLLLLYDASERGEGHREKMTAMVEEKKLDAVKEIFAPELFTDEITSIVSEVSAMVSGPVSDHVE
jgi:hypothetical protein